MPGIADALNATTIRHESGLSNELVGVRDTREFDTVINTRKAARALKVELELANAATPHAWPFSIPTLRTLHPEYSDNERASIANQQWSLAVDATRLYTLGDLFLRAVQRDPEYRLKAELYYAQARETLDTAKASVRAVITGNSPDDEKGEGIGE